MCGGGGGGVVGDVARGGDNPRPCWLVDAPIDAEAADLVVDIPRGTYARWRVEVLQLTCDFLRLARAVCWRHSNGNCGIAAGVRALLASKGVENGV